MSITGSVSTSFTSRAPCQHWTPTSIRRYEEFGLVKLLTARPFAEILANAGYQGLGAPTGGRVGTPPHRKFKKNAPDWYEEMHERQRKAHSSRRIRVEHGIAHLKNWRVLARHHGRREHMTDIIQAVADCLHRGCHRRPAARRSPGPYAPATVFADESTADDLRGLLHQSR
ncbi:transposase family protein [Streptomyces sp. NBC_00019]|uniref:transposase family protein n=1 Tax=Streptomyces sp. NBC_00019 TaxID=2975623 RepID=UPI00324D62CF